MDFFIHLLTTDSVPHTVLVLSLVGSFGLLIGSIRIFGVSLGIAGVLFAGLLFGHLGLTIDSPVMEFIREFGLILFVYTIGVQVGPGFVASLKKDGLKLNLMAGSVVILGVMITVLISRLGGIDMTTAVGLFSGATTNTPSLAAAQQTLKDIPTMTEEILKNPGIGYAVAYPFGILGIIITMVLVRIIFRINPVKEAQDKSLSEPLLLTINLKVKNNNLDGLPIEKIPFLNQSGIVISRILHNGTLSVGKPDSILHSEDVILAVGPKEKLAELKVVVGEESPLDLRNIQSNITSRRILVTNKDVLGKTIQELGLFDRFGITITRVSRSEIEFTCSADFRVQFADSLLAVGSKDGIQNAAKELGDSPRHLDHPQVIPIFLGIVLGVIVGSVPVYVPGVSVPVKLGLAGGPLIVAIVLSRIRRIGSLIWYMPSSANFMLREVGIVLFLACVGLKSGDQFIKTLTEGQGLYWMACATLITFIPIMIVALLARIKFKTNYLSLCGLLAGSMTDPPALAFANAISTSNAPSISYASVYPLVMLLRVISAQVLVLMFVR